MPNPAVAIPAAAGIFSSISSANASDSAASKQAGAAYAGAQESQRQFEAMRSSLAPYIYGGYGAQDQMSALLGLPGYAYTPGTTPGYGAAGQEGQPSQLTPPNPADYGGSFNKSFIQAMGQYQRDLALESARNAGVTPVSGPIISGADRQSAAISQIANSPLLQSLIQRGEGSILQNAAATGGLRGGNTQAALSQFAPAMLKQQIDDQYNRLAGMAQMGQASAAGVGSAGIQTGANIANLLQNAGAAQAAGTIGSANAYTSMFDNIAKLNWSGK